MSTWSHLSVATQLLLTLDRLSRHLCSPLYRCLLCPVGEGFEGTRTQPSHGVCNGFLWAHRYYRKPEKTIPIPHPGTYPATRPYPVAYHYLPLPSGASDFVHPLGDWDPDIRGPANGRYGHLVCDIPTPSHGCGHNNSTSLCANSTPSLAVADDAYRQVYRMYHIYDRNPFVCVLPSITIAALFGKFVSPHRFPLSSLSLSRDFLAVGCGVAHQLQKPIPNLKALFAWSTASFCLTVL